MASNPYGRVLSGSEESIRRAFDRWRQQAVDLEWLAQGDARGPRQTTLARQVSVTGPGTFLGAAERRLTFRPTRRCGWWFDRQDLPTSMPIRVSVDNVWTTVRNIVLSSGSPHNYMRMVEHIVALKPGLGLDNLLIRMDSGDPPLFDRSSLDLVEAVDRAGIVELDEPAQTVRVKEPVCVGGAGGSFLMIQPPAGSGRRLDVDCAVDFRSAIGRQRIRFTVTPETFRHGAAARTNTTFGKVLYCRTIGKIFADVRNLGYTTNNILIAGRRRYGNEAKLMHKGKSLEAVWHRATLDLLAAVALIDRGRLAGTIVSYKAGHSLDVEMLRRLYENDLLEAY